jgi:hypothetical protein
LKAFGKGFPGVFRAAFIWFCGWLADFSVVSLHLNVWIPYGNSGAPCKPALSLKPNIMFIF